MINHDPAMNRRATRSMAAERHPCVVRIVVARPFMAGKWNDAKRFVTPIYDDQLLFGKVIMYYKTLLLLFGCFCCTACGVFNAGQPAPTSLPTTLVRPTSMPEQMPSPTPFPTALPQPAATAVVRTGDLPKIALAVVADGFNKPLYLADPGDNSGRLFVVEQAGVVKIVQNGVVADQPFLDITDRVGSSGNEQGLLSIAFHPVFAQNGLFFVDYTNKDGNTVVSRFHASANQADPASEVVILTQDQPYANHNGGLVLFGPDKMLYISLGDGGSAGDPENHAQDPDSLLGKILRIDIDHGSPYAIPTDNPWANGGGRPEIWLWGLRNPWRFSFDRATGDMYIGDVGQNRYEEIDYLPAAKGGVNFGWKQVEGNQCYVDECDFDAYQPPIIEYSHDQGECSVTGGYVYHGTAFPKLQGFYFYGDYCTGRIWALRLNANGWQQSEALAKGSIKLSSFGEDQAGELYVIDQAGRLLHLTAG